VRDRGKSEASEHVSEARLAEAIQRRQRNNANQPVVISADKSVRYEAVMRVMDRLQKLGVARIGLLVRPAQT
jgi:biopolymer transport protein TolR